MSQQNREQRIFKKQKTLYLSVLALILAASSAVFFLSSEGKESHVREQPPEEFQAITQEVDPENIRIAHLENISDLFQKRVQTLEKTLLDIKEEKILVERDKAALSSETSSLKQRLQELEAKEQEARSSPAPQPEEIAEGEFQAWTCEEAEEDHHVLFEIPAGTVVRAVLVSGADCSVAVQKPTGPNMVLLRPLDNGKLPRKVSVPLKGSVIIGNAIGDINSERVYIRGERLTLVERNGTFIETDVSAYVSGEDGREGMRGVVVDRSGQIITRAAFAAFLQGVGQTVEATLNNQVLEKLARVSAKESILNLDMLRNSAFQGGTTAMNKVADYMIKRAEQLQPAIQIAAGRVVDIVFTKSVRIGENDLHKKLDHERQLKRSPHA